MFSFWPSSAAKSVIGVCGGGEEGPDRAGRAGVAMASWDEDRGGGSRTTLRGRVLSWCVLMKRVRS